ncbi:TetR/AcrR family transcriptional regulator [Actinoplanes missouriensis]|uniref:TetR/AcrR family transcriptional regulator n=1 Tax=Actinoplanes missouriensis TaxID=1866 RepID=UPI0033E23757
MTQVARQRPRGAGKAHLHDTALRLFARDGVEGTSLQAIADEMGVTKAAVYYHYKTKEDIVLGVLAPLLQDMTAVVTAAQTRRGQQARREAFLAGFVDLVLTSRSRFTMLLRDPYVLRLLTQHPDLMQWWLRSREIVVGANPDPAAHIPWMIFLGGLGTPMNDPAIAELDDNVLRERFLEVGRRLLNLRHPPRH